MVTVFSQVSAFVSADFVSEFPLQFRFDDLLYKICDNTDVTVSYENEVFVLEGNLEALLSVQNMLVSSYAVFGTNAAMVSEVCAQVNGRIMPVLLFMDEFIVIQHGYIHFFWVCDLKFIKTSALGNFPQLW